MSKLGTRFAAFSRGPGGSIRPAATPPATTGSAQGMTNPTVVAPQTPVVTVAAPPTTTTSTPTVTATPVNPPADPVAANVTPASTLPTLRLRPPAQTVTVPATPPTTTTEPPQPPFVLPAGGSETTAPVAKKKKSGCDCDCGCGCGCIVIFVLLFLAIVSFGCILFFVTGLPLPAVNLPSIKEALPLPKSEIAVEMVVVGVSHCANLRETSEESSKIITCIPKGETVSFLSKIGFRAEVEWKGQRGWVALEFLESK